MKPLNLIFLTACLLMLSCTTSKLLTSTLPPAEVTDLKLLEPCSYISKITKGNRGEIDDSMSAVSSQLLVKVAESFKGQIPLTGKIILSDSAVNNDLEKEFESLSFTAEKMDDVSHLQITPTLDKVLEANEARFGLITVATGFTRIKGNYGKEIVKGAALGLLTLGMYYQSPVKAYSTIYVMIADSKENNVAFFRKSYLQDKEPLDEAVLTKQFKDIFTDYFFTKK